MPTQAATVLPGGKRYSNHMARAAILLAAACAFLATACTADHPAPVQTGAATSAPANSPSVPAGPPPVPGAAYTSGGCGATALLQGSAPGWASAANPPPIRYALAERGQVAGFLFGYPLMAGNPQPYSEQGPLGGCFPQGRSAAAAYRSSARCRYARRVLSLVSGFDARGDLPLGNRRPVARLLAVHPVLEWAYGHGRPLVRQTPLTSSPTLKDGVFLPSQVGFLVSQAAAPGVSPCLVSPPQAVTASPVLHHLAAELLEGPACDVEEQPSPGSTSKAGAAGRSAVYPGRARRKRCTLTSGSNVRMWRGQGGALLGGNHQRLGANGC